MKNICVFLAANLGNHPIYVETTKELGKEIAQRNLTLVYGGAKIGLMGTLADTVLAQGGKAIGIIPQCLVHQEFIHPDLTLLHLVDTMQERKSLMAELADAFVVMPGGIGTLEEVFEVWTAAKLGLHHKPIGLLNINNYFQKMIEFLEFSVETGFLPQKAYTLLEIATQPRALLDKILRKELLGV